MHAVCPSLSAVLVNDVIESAAWPLLKDKPSLCSRFLITPPSPSSSSLLPQVSLLEYRKRKRGSVRDPEPAGSSSSLGATPTRPGSHYTKDSHHHPHSQQQMQPTASPQSSFSSASAAATVASSSTHNASIPQIEEVSPPDHQGPPGKSRHQDSSNNQW